MIKIDGFEKQVKEWADELERFSNKLANNIHIGGLRVSANVIKEEVISMPMVTKGKNGKRYKKKNFLKSEIIIRKRRRTKQGWERFKISLKREASDEQERGKIWYYNIIAGSLQKKRYHDRGISRKLRKKRGKTDDEIEKLMDGIHSTGILMKDDFLGRSTIKASRKALSGYLYYVKQRTIKDGGVLSKEAMKKAKSGGNMI